MELGESGGWWLWTGLGAGLAGALWLDRQWRRARSRVALPSGLSLSNQRRRIGRSEHGTEVYTSILMDGDRLIDGPLDKKVQNTYDNFLEGMRLSGNGECLGVREGATFRWLSYREVLEGAQSIGMGFRALGQKTGAETFVGVYAKNGPEWVMAQLGATSQSMVIIPLYDTLGADAVTFVLNQASISLIVVDDDAKTLRLLDAKADLPTLTTIVSIAPPKSELVAAAKDKGVRLTSFVGAQALGRAESLQLTLPHLDDVALICYTSGTTGTPKGVMLSHRNLLANAAGNLHVASACGVDYASVGSTTISYLPLAHLFEQMNQLLMFSCGGRVGFFSGDVRKLLEDCQILKPHVFPVVPRLLNRLSDGIKIKLENSNFIARSLFSMAYNAKLAEMKAGVIRKDSIWDRLVFNKIQAQLGGEVRVMATGSAPISPEVLEMCRVVLGCVILEGYGQTECTAVASITLPGEFVGGHVGGPGPAAHLTLVDVPELDYFSKDGKGEICVRGPCVTRGYFKDPEKTAETIDKYGWLHTGDIARWEPNGTLRIIDRAKHIFKLAQGEYVAPEKIESVYTRSVAVEQVFVDGSSLERYLVAIVVPNVSDLQYWWKENKGSEVPSFEEMCKNKEVQAYVLKDMRKIGKENGLNSIEQVAYKTHQFWTMKKDLLEVQAIFLTPEVFTLENGLLTPTMKSKRPQLRKHYAQTFTRLYEETNKS